MTLLDSYLLKQYAKNLLMVLAALLAIYLLVDIFERLDNFIEAEKPLALAFKYFILKIPAITEQLMPVCILLGGVITLGLLNHHYELIALKAGGISILRITTPLIGGGLLFTLLIVAGGQWLLPITNATVNRIWYEEVRDQTPKGIYRDGNFYYHGSQGFYTFTRPHPQKHLFRQFSYAAWDESYGLTTLLSADTATWENGKWQFSKGQLKKKTESGEYQIKIFDHLSLDLPETPELFFIPPYKSIEMTISQLWAQTRAPATRDDPEIRQQLHGRLSYMFLGLPLLLLGLPILIIVHQKWERDISLAIPASCVLAFAAWIGWGTCQSMAKAAYLNPVVAAWSIHLAIGGLGLFLLRRQNR